MKYTKGFTLIELLVVVAIIGMLSSVVLASLNSARGKSFDSAAKADMASVRNQAQLSWTNNNGSFANVCNDSNAILQGGLNTGHYVAWSCQNNANAWAAAVQLKSSGYWCVDSVGFVGARVNALGGATVCPAS